MKTLFIIALLVCTPVQANPIAIISSIASSLIKTEPAKPVTKVEPVGLAKTNSEIIYQMNHPPGLSVHRGMTEPDTVDPINSSRVNVYVVKTQEEFNAVPEGGLIVDSSNNWRWKCTKCPKNPLDRDHIVDFSSI